MGGRRKWGQRQRQFDAILKGEAAPHDEMEASEPHDEELVGADGGETTHTHGGPSYSAVAHGSFSGSQREAAPCASGEHEQAQNSCEKGTCSPL